MVLYRQRKRAETLVQTAGVRKNSFPWSMFRIRYFLLIVLAGVSFLPYPYESGGDAEVFPMTAAAIYAKYPDLVDKIYFKGGGSPDSRYRGGRNGE